MPATGGCRHLLHVRPWSCAHLHGHGHALTFKGTRTAIVIHARPRQRPGAFLTRPAYGLSISSANPVHSSALRLRNTSADLRVQPAYSKRLGGMGMASPRDTTTTGAPRSSRPEGLRLRPGGVDPRGAGAGRTRQKPAGAAPDRTGRMADHAGQARRHASAWVRSLHFSTLSRISWCLVDFFQAVVRLFQ